VPVFAIRLESNRREPINGKAHGLAFFGCAACKPV
jgi:hypothetical protein